MKRYGKERTSFFRAKQFIFHDEDEALKIYLRNLLGGRRTSSAEYVTVCGYRSM